MKNTQQQGQELVHSLILKSWEDEDFKNQLVASPVETIEAFLGKKLDLPEDVKLVVNDQTNSSVVNINVPRKESYDSVELTDEQLEAVSGGLAFSTVCGILFVGSLLICAISEGCNN